VIKEYLFFAAHPESKVASIYLNIVNQIRDIVNIVDVTARVKYQLQEYERKPRIRKHSLAENENHEQPPHKKRKQFCKSESVFRDTKEQVTTPNFTNPHTTHNSMKFSFLGTPESQTNSCCLTKPKLEIYKTTAFDWTYTIPTQTITQTITPEIDELCLSNALEHWVIGQGLNVDPPLAEFIDYVKQFGVAFNHTSLPSALKSLIKEWEQYTLWFGNTRFVRLLKVMTRSIERMGEEKNSNNEKASSFNDSQKEKIAQKIEFKLEPETKKDSSRRKKKKKKKISGDYSLQGERPKKKRRTEESWQKDLCNIKPIQ